MAAASVVSRKPRWLRAITPTPSPGPIPIAAKAWASALERWCRRSQVSEPRSSRIAISCGCSIAAMATPVAGEAPQRRKVAPDAQRLVRTHRPDDPGLVQHPPLEEEVRDGPPDVCFHPYPPSNREHYWPGGQQAIPVSYRGASQSSSTSATAMQAMPSPRPIQPMPSLVVALTVTRPEVASPRICSICAL